MFYGETEIRVAQLADKKLEGLKIVVDKKAPKLGLAPRSGQHQRLLQQELHRHGEWHHRPGRLLRHPVRGVLGGKGPHRDGQGTETQREMLYTYTKGGDILQELDGLSFTVDAGKNNSDNVVIYVQVTDRAGNVSKPERRQ